MRERQLEKQENLRVRERIYLELVEMHSIGAESTGEPHQMKSDSCASTTGTDLRMRT